jgi:hypothetical protein
MAILRLVALATVALMAVALAAAPTHAVPLPLNADTPATGSNLGIAPLVTAFGTVTFDGQIRPTADPDLFNAGSVINVFDVDESETATLFFDFDVESITFIYGGNDGAFDIEARDINGNVVDSFFQASTGDGQPAGPIVLSGGGIRSLYWEDPGFQFAAIDNLVVVAAVPEPAALVLAAIGLCGLLVWRRGKR